MTIKELKQNIRSEIYQASWESKTGVMVIDINLVMRVIDKELKKFDKENKQ